MHTITLHYITLHYITFRDTTWHYMPLHYMTLHDITLHYIHTVRIKTKGLKQHWDQNESGKARIVFLPPISSLNQVSWTLDILFHDTYSKISPKSDLNSRYKLVTDLLFQDTPFEILWTVRLPYPTHQCLRNKGHMESKQQRRCHSRRWRQTPAFAGGKSPTKIGDERNHKDTIIMGT